MVLPTRLTIRSYTFLLDGGTTTLYAIDEVAKEHHVTLMQHAFPQARSGEIPGRLYFNGHLVPQRLELESGLIALLRNAQFSIGGLEGREGDTIKPSPNALILGDDIKQVLSCTPEQNLRYLTKRVVDFVESDEYLSFVEHVEAAADTAVYDVWIDWTPENRNQVIVRLGNYLGSGLRRAHEILDLNLPIAQGVSGLDVIRFTSRYRSEGLSLRVVPKQ